MNLLKETKIPVHLLLGNHDIEDITYEIGAVKNSQTAKTSPISEDDKKENMCKSYDIQLEFSKDKNPASNIELFKDVKKIEDNASSTLIILIDTTIYTNPDAHCYKKNKLLDYKDVGTDKNGVVLDILKKNQEDSVKKILEANPDKKNIIFVGHHPLVAYEVADKKDKKKNKDKDKKKGKEGGGSDAEGKELSYPDFTDFFCHLIDLLNGKNIYHLCADSHYYENSLISIVKHRGKKKKIEINQYISATGGGELYKTAKVNKELSFCTYDCYKVHYKILDNSKNFGFLMCAYDDIEKKWNFNFQKVDFESDEITSEIFSKHTVGNLPSLRRTLSESVVAGKVSTRKKNKSKKNKSKNKSKKKPKKNKSKKKKTRKNL